MFYRKTFIFISILSLALFSSCGIIKIDFSVPIAQFTDFSDTTYYENSIDSEYYRPTSPVPCLRIYAPVCGCDGVTYGNACEAKRSGVAFYTKGKCVDFWYKPPKRLVVKGRAEKK